MIVEYKPKTYVMKMKTNKIWKVGVSTVVGLLMALWLVVPSAIAVNIECGVFFYSTTILDSICLDQVFANELGVLPRDIKKEMGVEKVFVNDVSPELFSKEATERKIKISLQKECSDQVSEVICFKL